MDNCPVCKAEWVRVWTGERAVIKCPNGHFEVTEFTWNDARKSLRQVVIDYEMDFAFSVLKELKDILDQAARL